MKIAIQIVLLFSFVALPTIIRAQDQVNMRAGIKAGYEFVNYSLSQSETFKKEPGYTFGYFTGISSASNSSAAVDTGI